MDIPNSASPYDPTIDAHAAAPPDQGTNPSRLVRGDSHRPVALVEGSAPELSAETAALLHERLKTASLLLFCGYLAFLVKGLFDAPPRSPLIGWLIFGEHLGMTVLTGIIGLRMCRECPKIKRHLRMTELLVFGGSAIFFLLISWDMLARTAAEGYLRSIAPLWMLLVFTYALFVPNTWKRAACVIGLIAAAPTVLVLGFRFLSPTFAQVVRDNPHFHGYEIELVLMIALTAVGAVWGVRTIGSLRRQAFEARQLGQYRLKQPLGSGGMGEVYLAEHVLLKRPCAIKLIRPDKAGDARSLARFEREVRATAKLTHWNTVEIFDYGRADDGTFYYVMEYLPGLNLGQLVDLHGPLPPERVIHLLTQICDALGEAHRHELIHRDIKPGNIFAANRGGVYDVAKLLDFGLVKPLVEVSESALTQEGAITGSPLFMSPEQATGDSNPDARSDIYALGVVAYFLLTGKPPFAGDSAMRILLAHIQSEPAPPSTVVADIPADLEAVVMRCLHKNPADRFQTTDQLREALLDCGVAGLWTRDMARQWWECHGCPQKKALDSQIMAMSAV